MFEVDVKNVTEKGRGPARVWGSYVVQFSTIEYNTVQYSTIQYNTVQYSTIQYNTVKCSTKSWWLSLLG